MSSAEQAGLSLTWLETPKTGFYLVGNPEDRFSRDEAQMTISKDWRNLLEVWFLSF